MQNHYDVIVIGVGAMGSATCFELARRGVRVLGLEQFQISHDRGSSHGYTRLIRLAYYEHADYVPLLRRGYEKWRELESVSRRRILFVTGGLYCGPGDGELVAGSAASARQHGIEFERLDRDEVARRFPQFRLPDHYAAVYEPAAGFLRPELAITTYAIHARLGGADIREAEPVRGWSSSNTRVTVETEKQTYTADRIIFTGGAWTSKLVNDLGIPLTVTRQLLGWVRPRTPGDFTPDRFPCWAIEQRDGSLYYGVPQNEFEPGLKIAHHKPGAIVDADRVSRVATLDDADEIARMTNEVLPTAAVGGAGAVAEMRICLYTNSPDSHFIIGPHPNDQRVLLACGFSGHGFKFASVIGEVLCDLAMHGATELPIAFLSPTRFKR